MNTTPNTPAKRTRKPSAKKLAETIKAAAESDAAEVIELKVAAAKPRRTRKAKDSDLVFVPGVGTTLPAETPAKPKRAPKAPKSVEPKTIEAVKSISPSAAGRLGDKVGKDFIVRWPKGGADLLQRVAGEGAAWLVRCNAHSTTTEAANVKAADLAGRKAQRVVWCAECAAAAK